MYKTLATYQISPGLSLFLVRGSVVHFEGKTEKAAIVNAANPGCLGGGGVDGAISAAGGARLMEDRLHLPVLERRGEYEIRCQVGSAVCTGPGDYDDLRVSYVLHAVGPNYHNFEEENYDQAHELLKSAYSTTLDVASENRIEEIGFSLLSAGIFRGSCSLEQVLLLGIESILWWGVNKPEDTSVSDIHLFAFTGRECKILKKICDQAFGIEPEEAQESSEEIAMDTQETTKVESERVADKKLEENNDMETKPADIDTTVKKYKEESVNVDQKTEEKEVESGSTEKADAVNNSVESKVDESGSTEKADAANNSVEAKVDEGTAKGDQEEIAETPKETDAGETSQRLKSGDGKTNSSTNDSVAAKNGSGEYKQDK